MKCTKTLLYHGLITRRMTVEAPLILATSTATVKVKTKDVSTTNWVEEEVDDPLSTSFESSF